MGRRAAVEARLWKNRVEGGHGRLEGVEERPALGRKRGSCKLPAGPLSRADVPSALALADTEAKVPFVSKTRRNNEGDADLAIKFSWESEGSVA